MVGTAVGRILVAISMLGFKSYDDYYTETISAITSSATYYYYNPRSLLSSSNSYYDYDINNIGELLELECLILARKGSKGIPYKNMIQLNGQPLIHYALNAVIQSRAFTKIWISTDDPLVSEYIKKVRNNLTEPIQIKVHNRAWYTATDEATSLMAVQEFLNSHPEVEGIGLIQITSPFIQPNFIAAAASLMRTKNLDSVFSVTRQHKLRWSEVASNNKNNNDNNEPDIWTQPLNFDTASRPRRQSWSGELVENGMFYFATSKIIMDGLLQGPRSLYYEIPKEFSLEIDSVDDLALAEILMKKREHNVTSESDSSDD